MFGASIKPTAIESCKSIVDQLLDLGALTDTLQRTLGLSPSMLPNLNLFGGAKPGDSFDGLAASGKPKEKSKPKRGGILSGLLRR